MEPLQAVVRPAVPILPGVVEKGEVVTVPSRCHEYVTHAARTSVERATGSTNIGNTIIVGNSSGNATSTKIKPRKGGVNARTTPGAGVTNL